MTLLASIRQFWPLSTALVVLTVTGVWLLESETGASYSASGTVMIARPEVDPSRVASRSVNLAVAIAATSTSDAREAFVDEGGRDDYRIIQVSENRLQVLAIGDGAPDGVRAVLRSLADVVASQQLEAGVDVDERIRPRLFVQVAEDELESLAAMQGRVSGEPPEIIGTLVLEDPLAGVENALGSPATATRLVTLSIKSDAGTAAVLDTLPDGVGFWIDSFDRRARELLTVTTTGPEPTDVVDAFDVVVAAVDAELQRRQEQAEVPSDARLLVDVVATPLVATKVDAGLSTNAFLILTLGLGTALAIPAIMREVITARSRASAAADQASRDRLHDDVLDDNASRTGLPH